MTTVRLSAPAFYLSDSSSGNETADGVFHSNYFAFRFFVSDIIFNFEMQKLFSPFSFFSYRKFSNLISQTVLRVLFYTFERFFFAYLFQVLLQGRFWIFCYSLVRSLRIGLNEWFVWDAGCKTAWFMGKQWFHSLGWILMHSSHLQNVREGNQFVFKHPLS